VKKNRFVVGSVLIGHVLLSCRARPDSDTLEVPQLAEPAGEDAMTSEPATQEAGVCSLVNGECTGAQHCCEIVGRRVDMAAACMNKLTRIGCRREPATAYGCLASESAECFSIELDGSFEVYFLPSTASLADLPGYARCDPETRARVMDGYPPCAQ
jgi:hypothetical protein